MSLFNRNIFNSGVFNTGSAPTATVLFNRNVFGSPPLFNTGEESSATSSIRGHIVRRRGRRYKWPIEEIAFFTETEIVEVSTELAQEEITELQVSKEKELVALHYTQADIHKQLIKIELQEITIRQEIYRDLKQRIMDYLIEEEDIQALMLLI